jgi:hypothetical protein
MGVSEGEKITETRRNFIADSGSALGGIAAWFSLESLRLGKTAGSLRNVPLCPDRDAFHRVKISRKRGPIIKEAISAWRWAEDQKAARNAKAGEPEILLDRLATGNRAVVSHNLRDFGQRGSQSFRKSPLATTWSRVYKCKP